MLTPAFMRSEFCYGIEMVRAKDRDDKKQASLIPLMVEAVSLEGSFLADLQYFPSEEPPLVDRPNRSVAVKAVADEIIRRVLRLRDERRSAYPLHANLPPQASGFVGRERILADLRQEFAGKGDRRCQAIVGASGMGKSAVVAEFAHLNRADYDVMWWVRAKDPEERDGDYAALASELGLPHADQRSAIDAVRRWLDLPPRGIRRWLVVFDDAADPDGVRSLLPRGVRGDVLITSKQPAGWDALATAHRLGALETDEAISYLCASSGDHDPAAAGQLVRRFGTTPNALMQMALTVRNQELTLEEYPLYLELRRERD
jgi:hypothetical protein